MCKSEDNRQGSIVFYHHVGPLGSKLRSSGLVAHWALTHWVISLDQHHILSTHPQRMFPSHREVAMGNVSPFLEKYTVEGFLRKQKGSSFRDSCQVLTPKFCGCFLGRDSEIYRLWMPVMLKCDLSNPCWYHWDSYPSELNFGRCFRVGHLPFQMPNNAWPL